VFPGLYYLAQGVFWLCLGLLVFAFAGYHALMWLWARQVKRGQPAALEPVPDADLPRMTVVLVARNEEARVPGRVANLLGGDYPAGKLDVLLVSDGSTDGTAEAGRQAGARVLERPERRGKSACLNAGVGEATGEIVAFADARQEFAPDTLRRLAEAFARCPRAGAVSGSLEIAATGAGAAGGVDIYWRLEKLLRHSEAVVDSAIGCTGAVYAVRRELWDAVPEDTLVEDVVIPMRIAQRAPGWRVLFEPAAMAYDPQKLEPEKEKGRKRRTLAGNFQMIARYPHWLLPGGHRLWWQLISHKYLRLGGPLFLLGMLLANLALAAFPPASGGSWILLFLNGLYRITFLGQLAFYGLAVAGMLFPALKTKALSIPAGFVFLNLQVLEGLSFFLKRRGVGW
jgi:cellulose synthase/poly-beta-1,6-N-acetylglucosamine synthase-like glycosyltransferase